MLMILPLARPAADLVQHTSTAMAMFVRAINEASRRSAGSR
jgi:hypothetical protein